MPGIQITPRPFYLAEQSDPDDAQYAFGYEITITNHSGNDVQLMDRHWLISDGNGQHTEVQGQGVVGQQPVIATGHPTPIRAVFCSKRPLAVCAGVIRFRTNTMNSYLR